MCGIAGYFTLLGRETVPRGTERLEAQICTLRHRGPDAQRVVTGPGVGLAHARLAIIDLSPEADQPMASDDGRVTIVFNGEIYNFEAIRAELAAQGRRFRTRSDTETILQGYQAWGLGVVERLRGMFAIALWDRDEDRLILIRDRIGKKPLYYTIVDDVLLFASEIKGLLAWPNVPRAVAFDAVHDYLTFQYVPSPKTAFKGILELPPAHLMVLERSREPRPERYYSFPAPPEAPAPARKAPRLETLKEELVQHLKEATRLRLVADVPLGAFLSGGVDSSSVVAMMALSSAAPVKTFTIGFAEELYDERPFARQVAERYGTDHRELVVRPDVVQVLPAIVYHYGEPFADSSAIPTYCISEIARQHVTVALTGDGADESFLGYQRYVQLGRLATLASGMPPALRRILAAGARLAPSVIDRWRPARIARQLLGSLDGSASRLYGPFIAYFSDDAKQAIYGGRLRPSMARPSLAALDPYLGAGRPPASRAAWADINTYLPDDLLIKVDVASMAHSLECRAPFLDHVLMEWAMGIPEAARLRGGEPKALLKMAMEPYLPKPLLYRRKMGFAVPVEQWLRGEMRELATATLLSRRAVERGMFRPDAVRALLDQHAQGINHARRIWALLMLELWMQMWIDGPVPQAPGRPSSGVRFDEALPAHGS